MGKNSTLPAFLLSKLINDQGGIFCLLHGKLRAGWKENLENLSEHALLLGTSEYLNFALVSSDLVQVAGCHSITATSVTQRNCLVRYILLDLNFL